MADELDIENFLKKFADNNYTEKEHAIFINWLNSATIEDVKIILERYQKISESKPKEEQIISLLLVKKIETKLNQLAKSESEIEKRRQKATTLISTPSIAVAFILFILLGIYVWSNQNTTKQIAQKTELTVKSNDVLPGGNKAKLTLSDGEVISLDNNSSGVLAIEGNIRIFKSTNGKITYDVSSPAKFNSKPTYNIISTPRGGQYQISLSDGTKVWLNASSSLRFPTEFSTKERVVELTGEAYFEVTQVVSGSLEEKNVPFKIISRNQVLEVLGTQFNINAYPDETTINTTLLEGSIRIQHLSSIQSYLLKPGQMAKVGTDIHVFDVDASQAIAWKNGYFNFSNEEITSVMRKISRWYDIDIIYNKGVTKEEFVGSISKYKNVSQVLEMLQLTGSVHFKIDSTGNGNKERRIIVMP